MFREMRRSNQQLDAEGCREVLERCTSGVLALAGDGGYPYAVPMSFCFDGGKIYFHSALTGHKIDSIANCGRCSFCVIERDDVVQDDFTTIYRSVIVFGRIRLLESVDERRRGLGLLADKYSPGAAGREREIASGLARAAVLELCPEHISGKQSKELVQKKQTS